MLIHNDYKKDLKGAGGVAKINGHFLLYSRDHPIDAATIQEIPCRSTG